MKKVITKILIVTFLAATLSGCGDSKVIKNKEIPTYGFINKTNDCYEGVEYRVIFGNVVWGILLIETIIAPIYFFGFSLYEPVGIDTGPKTIKE